MLLSAVNLNGTGHYVHWWMFTVSVANLVVIAVMLVIFAAALLIPMRVRDRRDAGPPVAAPAGGPVATDGSDGAGDPADAAMWTNRLRRRAVAALPPRKLLPDRQPAYVASWVYVFGVASLATFVVVLVSGFAIALGGPDWWHTDSVGHFFNSLHLWSVELFMAFMVIHLWGKFWMAAWRGRRAATWVTGVVAFLASVIECFTGYLSQQNFDSQWVATNGKDAINATGLGGWWNLMNFGQMLMWHIVLLPLALLALVGGHVLLVRVRGVVPPLPEKRSRTRGAWRAARRADAAEWRGPTRRYDLVKEGTVAVTISLALVLLLAGLLSSPDEPAVSLATWAKAAPDDFLATSAAELGGTSTSAQYGPPYNNGTGSVQRIIVSWQTLAGVRIPVDPAQAFVLQPLALASGANPALTTALATYNAASPTRQQAWTQAYLDEVAKVTFRGAVPVMPPGAYGPVATLMADQLALARSGGLDSTLLTGQSFYGTNFTKPLLYLADGEWYAGVAAAQHLTGDQWGVTNETGNYPGQPWLWLYQLWYHAPALRHSSNVDLIAIYLTGAATLLLLAVPWIPGIRRVPEYVPLHRLVWRDWYHHGTPPAGPPSRERPATTPPAVDLTRSDLHAPPAPDRPAPSEPR